MAIAKLDLKSVAEELGVHYMTVYRYVRLGQLPAHKESATWVVRRSDLDRFKKGEATPTRRGSADWAKRIEKRLIAGDEAGAWKVVEAALASGKEPSEIYTTVLAPALASIGERWADGELSVADEHRASGVAFRVVGRLGPMFSRRGRSKGTVVIGTPPGELHSLPSAMAADFLRGAGYEVMDLGANTPADSFIAAARQADRLVSVAVSVTSSDALGSAKKVIRSLGKLGVPIVVGGSAVTDDDTATALGADGWATDGLSAVELVDGIAS